MESPALAAHLSSPKRICHFFCAALHIRKADIQSVHLRNENHLLPRLRLPHIAFVTASAGFAFWMNRPYLIQAAGVDNWLCIMISAEYHQQVRNHCRFPFFI